MALPRCLTITVRQASIEPSYRIGRGYGLARVSWHPIALHQFARRRTEARMECRNNGLSLVNNLRPHFDNLRDFNSAHCQPASVTCHGKRYRCHTYWDTPYSVAMALGLPERHTAVCGKFNGELLDMNAPLTGDGQLEFVMPNSPDAETAVRNAGPVLLGYTLEHGWRTSFVSNGMLPDGSFFFNLQRLNMTEDIKKDELAYMENYMLEAAKLPHACIMLRADQLGRKEIFKTKLKKMYKRDHPRLVRLLKDVDGLSTDGQVPYLCDSYLNRHTSPVPAYLSVVKAVALDGCTPYEEDGDLHHRFTGRVFSSVEKFHDWMEANDRPVDRYNPLCRHSHWQSLSPEFRQPFAPLPVAKKIKEDGTSVPVSGQAEQEQEEEEDASEDVVAKEDLVTDEEEMEEEREETDEIEEEDLEEEQEELEEEELEELEKLEEEEQEKVVLSSSKRRVQNYSKQVFSLLHDATLVAAHSLRNDDEPTEDEMAVLINQHLNLFASDTSVSAQPAHLVHRWIVLKTRETLRLAHSAERAMYSKKALLLARNSDIGTPGTFRAINDQLFKRRQYTYRLSLVI